jgi:hypothetical protein
MLLPSCPLWFITTVVVGSFVISIVMMPFVEDSVFSQELWLYPLIIDYHLNTRSRHH